MECLLSSGGGALMVAWAPEDTSPTVIILWERHLKWLESRISSA